MTREQNNFPSGQGEEMMIFGLHPVMEAVAAGKEVERIYLQRGLRSPQVSHLRKLLSENGIHAVEVPVEKLNRLTRKNHQGVICFLSHVSYHIITDLVPQLFEHPRYPLLLLLDRITDVRNFGAICRTAECTGVDAIIVPEKGGARVNGDAVKASAGALNRMKICREFNLKETITYIKDSGFTIVGCTEKGATESFNFRYDKPICIIMGSEEDGISPEYLKRCDAKVRIPLQGTVSSLNVSVAAGMILYEILRQRHVEEQ